MELVFAIPLLVIGLYVFFLAAIWFIRVAYGHLVYALNTLGEDFQTGTAAMADNLERRTEKRRAERRLAMVAGVNGEIDWEAVEARKQIPILRSALEEELPQAVVHCIRMHRLAARAVGAVYIREIAHQPECAGSRRKVVVLAGVSQNILEGNRYFIENENYMANLIALRAQVLPTCKICPYLKHKLAYAPLLCPTAETLKIDPEMCRDDYEA